MRKPTCAGVGLLLLAAHCGGNGDPSPYTPESSGGSDSATGGAAASPSATTGGTQPSEVTSGGAAGREVDGETGGTPTNEGGSGPTPSSAGGEGGSPESSGGVGGSGGQPEVDNGVSGYVLDNWDQPVPGVLVSIDGVATLTDEDGAFVISDVAPVYRLLLLQNDEHWVRIFDGLTTRHPKFLGQARNASVSTTLNGMVMKSDGTPLDGGHRAFAAFSANGAQRANTVSLVRDGGYSLSFDWAGERHVSGRLSVLAWSVDSDNLPISYDGYAMKTATLSEDAPADPMALAATLELGEVSTRTLHGTIDAPLGYSATLDYQVGPVAPIKGAKPDATFSFQVPKGTGETCWLTLLLQHRVLSTFEFSAVRRLVSDSNDDLELVVPRAPALVMPVDDAVNLTQDSSFQWMTHQGQVATVHFDISGFSIDISTSESSVTLPDLSSFGIVYEPGSTGTWEVNGLGSAQSVDEAAEFAYSTQQFLETHGAADISRSLSRAFTLAR